MMPWGVLPGPGAPSQEMGVEKLCMEQTDRWMRWTCEGNTYQPLFS